MNNLATANAHLRETSVNHGQNGNWQRVVSPRHGKIATLIDGDPRHWEDISRTLSRLIRISI
jgi:hypothetical protein